MSADPKQIKALLFDKDGTLFDFRATWEDWAGQMIRSFAQGDDDTAGALADRLGYDLQRGCFLPSSFVIAGTNTQAAQAIAEVIESSDIAGIEAELIRSASAAPLSEAVPLLALCEDLRARGYVLGVMTNDNEDVALEHIDRAGLTPFFDFICGSDSGHGAKPDPGPLLAFCRYVQVDPFHTAMIGDSTHDLKAAQAAGMTAVGVLTGIAESAELGPLADVILPDIGHLPAWLSGAL